VIVRPLDFLSIGASFYDGSFAPSAGAASAVRDRVGMDLALLRGPFSLKAEFIGAEDGEVLREGWYVQAGWFFLPRMFQGVLRADSYDADRAASGDRKNVWTAGLNWILSGRTKLQANFELTRNEAGTTVNKALCVQLQAGF
jgi:phosphate-selective porin